MKKKCDREGVGFHLTFHLSDLSNQQSFITMKQNIRKFNFMVFRHCFWTMQVVLGLFGLLRENSNLDHMYNPIIDHLDIKTPHRLFYTCNQKIKQMTWL